jgi:uncharacterized cupin superfamily protein
MSDEPNILNPEWDAEMADAPFRAKAMRAGARAGSHELGATLYEIEAGGAISPYHFHHANEELLIVISGRPLLRTPEGSRRLAPGEVVAFPPGADGAHRVANPEDDEPARVLLISTMRFPEVADYPDTGATLTLTQPGAGKAFAGEAPYMEVFEEGMRRGAELDQRGTSTS